MFGKRKLDVVIVGGGPVGLFAALVLARRGVRVQIADKEWRTGAHSYALALHAQSLRWLEEVGLLPSILENGFEVTRIGLYDGSGQQAEVRLADNPNAVRSLVVLRQDILESLLEDALAVCGVDVLWNHRVSKLVLQPDKVLVTVDKLEQESLGYGIAHTEWVIAKSMECETSIVIGADGCHSFVRRAAGIEFPVVGDPQCYAVFESRSGMDLDHEMRIVMGDRTTDALWPLRDGFCRWSFELPGSSLPEDSRRKDRLALSVSGHEFPILSERSRLALIAERAPWFTGSMGEMDWRVAVRFEHRLASAFGKNRIWLAGDAAHLTGPVGMQSMNTGLIEARDLVDVICDVLHGGKRTECLESYNTRSLARWRRLLGRDDGLQCSEQRCPGCVNAKTDSCRAFRHPAANLTELAEQIGLRAS